MPLLRTLPKITGGRVLAGAEKNEIEGGFTLRIPVLRWADGDPKDVHLRRHIHRWLREQITSDRPVQIRHRFVRLKPGEASWTGEDGKTHPLFASIEVDVLISKEGEMDRFLREKERRKKRRYDSFRQELTTKDGGESL